MKYKFTQFGTLEIEPTEIEINLDSLVTFPKSHLFNVEVWLIVDNAKYSHTFEGLSYVGLLTDKEVEEVVDNELKSFEI